MKTKIESFEFGLVLGVEPETAAEFELLRAFWEYGNMRRSDPKSPSAFDGKLFEIEYKGHTFDRLMHEDAHAMIAEMDLLAATEALTEVRDRLVSLVVENVALRKWCNEKSTEIDHLQKCYDKNNVRVCECGLLLKQANAAIKGKNAYLVRKNAHLVRVLEERDEARAERDELRKYKAEAESKLNKLWRIGQAIDDCEVKL